MSLATRIGRAWRAAWETPATQQPAAARGAPATQHHSIYRGAEQSRLTSDWVTSVMAPDEEWAVSARELRKRARDLARNNPYIRRHLEIARQNIGSGYFQRAQVRDQNGELLDELNDAIDAAWSDFANGRVGVGNRLNLSELHQLAVETRKVDGEVFVRMWRGYSGNKHGLGLELIDADMVDERLNRAAAPGMNEIRNGIEYEPQFGEAVAYHVAKGQATVAGLQREHDRIPASEIVHRFKMRRPNQSRGISELATIMSTARHHDGFSEAAVIHARAAACQMAFIVRKQTNPFDVGGGELAGSGYQDPSAPPGAQGGVTRAPRVLDGAPGTMPELEVGEEVQSWAPNHPNMNHPEFDRLYLRRYAAALDGGYMSLACDPAAANFSSMRMDQWNARESWMDEQDDEIAFFLKPIRAAWLQMALLSGALDLGGTIDPEPFSAHEFRGKRWPYINPLEETQADALALSILTDSRQDITARTNRNWWDIVEKVAAEIKEAREQDIPLSTDPPSTEQNPGSNKNPNKDADKKDGDTKRNGSANQNRIGELLRT